MLLLFLDSCVLESSCWLIGGWPNGIQLQIVSRQVSNSQESLSTRGFLEWTHKERFHHSCLGLNVVLKFNYQRRLFCVKHVYLDDSSKKYTNPITA